jgi:uncharacterized membrane protein
MAKFSVRPSLAVKGRKFLGLRGFTGKPFHPPLTDVPIGAYVLAAAFDVVSWLWHGETWSTDFFKAATLCLVGGVIVSLGAALTGFLDWRISAPKGTQARRTANAHGLTMLIVTGLVVIDIVLRLGSYDVPAPTTSMALAALTVVVALAIAFGATIGGTLVFDYGFNVRTAGDSPAWHKSDRDLMPGEKPANSA